MSSSLDALMLIKVTAILAGAAFALRLPCRRSSAAVRHYIITGALASALLLPLLHLLVPTWGVFPTAVSPAPESAWRLGRTSIEPPPEAPATGAASSRTLALSEDENSPVLPAAGHRFGRLSWRRVVSATWGAGALGLLLLLAVRVAVMQRILRRSRRLRDSRWIRTADAMREELGVSQAVQLRRSTERSMPMTWGVRRPVILLPSDCATWTAGRRRAVLAHELAHVARRDVFSVLLGHVACAAYCIHPLSWWLARAASVERELACDATALELGVSPSEYADHIVAIATSHGRAPAVAPVFAAPTQLEQRIMAILDPSLNRRGLRPAIRGTVTALLSMLLLPLAGATPFRALSSMTPASPPSAQEPVSDVERFQRHLAAEGIGLKDVSALVRALASRQSVTRGAAAWALGLVGDTRVAPPLIVALDDADATVREWAARSLGRLRVLESVDPLVRHLTDPSANVREWAVRSLIDVGDRRAVDPLIARLGDESASVREWASRGLGSLGDPRALEPLASLADDPSPDVQEWSRRAIRMIQRRTVRTVTPTPRPASIVPPPEVPQRPDPSGGSTVEELVARLSDARPSVRADAARSLADFGNTYRVSQPPVEPLMPGMEAPRRTLVRAADRTAVDPLIRALGDGSRSVREWAARSLGSYEDGRTVEPLLHLLHDPSASVRLWAIRSLGEIGDQRAVQPLLRHLSNPDTGGGSESREWLLRSLGAMHDPATVGAFVAELSSGHSSLREWALRGLGPLRTAAAFDPMIARLDDPSSSVREWAVRALGALEDPRAIPHIEPLLHDTNSSVRRWARQALDHLSTG